MDPTFKELIWGIGIVAVLVGGLLRMLLPYTSKKSANGKSVQIQAISDLLEIERRHEDRELWKRIEQKLDDLLKR